MEVKWNKVLPDILQLNLSITAVSEVELYKLWSGQTAAEGEAVALKSSEPQTTVRPQRPSRPLCTFG